MECDLQIGILSLFAGQIPSAASNGGAETRN